MGLRPFFFLISESDSEVFFRAARGSWKSTIALEMSLEFRKVVRAWWWIDFKNLAKSCPLCSVLVPRVSIPGILGTNCDAPRMG